MNFFVELSLVLGVALVLSIVMRLLRQPQIIAYILTGILVGPTLLDIVHAADAFTMLAQFGVALLLFMVGINLNPRVIRDVGSVAVLTGLGQVLFTSAISYGLLRLLGFTPVVSIYLSIALAFSSTIIIMKLLSDKQATETLYGRISIGFLIVQDLIAVAILMVISSFTDGQSLAALALETLLVGVGLVAFVTLLGLYVIPRVLALAARSHELLFLVSITWAFLLAMLCELLGFSIEIGALLAGITVSTSTYRFEIQSRLKPLRDFFLIMFFILLGLGMSFTAITENLGPILVMSLFVLIGNPLIVLTLMGLLGHTRRNGFMAGLTVAQISEFSFILIALGVTVGHLTESVIPIITTVGLLTIAGSTYFITHAEALYRLFDPMLKLFERRDAHTRHHKHTKHDILLFGCNRIGRHLLETIERFHRNYLVIDHNPHTVEELERKKIPVRYGDASDSELLADLDLPWAKLVISTIADTQTNLLLLGQLRESHRRRPITIVVASTFDEAHRLYEAGASYVIIPHELGGHHARTMIEEYGLDLDRFLQERLKHMETLKKH